MVDEEKVYEEMLKHPGRGHLVTIQVVKAPPKRTAVSATGAIHQHLLYNTL